MNKLRYRDDDLLGCLPPLELEHPEEHLLTDEEFDQALGDYVDGGFPQRWSPAERKIRTEREALKSLAVQAFGEGALRAGAEAFSPLDLAIHLLAEALPHLPPDQAREVGEFLEEMQPQETRT